MVPEHEPHPGKHQVQKGLCKHVGHLLHVDFKVRIIRLCSGQKNLLWVKKPEMDIEVHTSNLLLPTILHMTLKMEMLKI